MPPYAFWDLTPRDVSIILAGRALADQRFLYHGTITGWRQASWAKAKKMPRLDEALRPFKPRDRRVMDRSNLREQLMAIARAMKIQPVYKKKE